MDSTDKKVKLTNAYTFLTLDSDSDSGKSVEEITFEEVSKVNEIQKVSENQSKSVLDSNDKDGWTTVSRKQKSRISREPMEVIQEPYHKQHKDDYLEKDFSDIIESIDKKTLVDKNLQCKDCKDEFNFIVKQQHYFLINRWNDPTRCYKCRKQKKQDRVLERSKNILENYDEEESSTLIIDEEDFLKDENMILIP
jgi:hypothetical protein